MPKVKEDFAKKRSEEILDACENLYKVKSFKDITINDIGKLTTFTRTSIYNYFENKEEIFLALFKREYDLWNAELEKILTEHKKLSIKDLAKLIANSLAPRENLFKLLSTNLYDMEAHSRLECLTTFKKSYKMALDNFQNCVIKFAGKSKSDALDITYLFFPFIFGVYPYTYATDKQKKAMEEAGIVPKQQSTYDMLYNIIIILLK